MDITRIYKELKNLRDLTIEPKFLVIQSEDDVYKPFKVRFLGPQQSIYKAGVFQVTIKLPINYPFAPPDIQFDTTIIHPNISSETGFICLDILKTSWSPILSLRTTLISLISLLTSPEPNDPQDAEVASLYIRDIAQFNQKVEYHVEVYSVYQDGDEILIPDELVKSLKEILNVDDDLRLRKILLKAKMDLNLAVEQNLLQ